MQGKLQYNDKVRIMGAATVEAANREIAAMKVRVPVPEASKMKNISTQVEIESITLSKWYKDYPSNVPSRDNGDLNELKLNFSNCNTKNGNSPNPMAKRSTSDLISPMSIDRILSPIKAEPAIADDTNDEETMIISVPMGKHEMPMARDRVTQP
jgi:hypothetical protein